MEMTMYRTYYPNGTNALLFVNGIRICYTIERPWLYNKPLISCIPEGRYPVMERWSPRFGFHLLVTGVPSRSLILFHPANDAATQLKGCIAPVTVLTGPGKGDCSRKAFRRLLLALGKTAKNQPHFLSIQKQRT
jgi:hypothetical protein